MDQVKQYSIDYQNIKISDEQVGKMIGYPDSEIPELVLEQLHNVRIESAKLCRIKGGFKRISDIQVNKDQFVLDGKKFYPNRIIAGSLKHVESAALFVCTAGESLSQWSGQLFKMEDSVKAYIADIFASLIVEKATDLIQSYLEELVKAENQNITNRYSPGYCDWDVSEQHQLFSLLPDNFCGVSLNEAALMNPIKSVSGIIGIGKDVKKTAYLCNQCEKTDCLLAIDQLTKLD